MGTVNISFHSVKDDSGIQVANMPPLLSENVTSSGTSAQSSAAPAYSEVVRVAPDTTVRILTGTDPTALASSVRMKADTVEYFTVKVGDKVAVIDE